MIWRNDIKLLIDIRDDRYVQLIEYDLLFKILNIISILFQKLLRDAK